MSHIACWDVKVVFTSVFRRIHTLCCKRSSIKHAKLSPSDHEQIFHIVNIVLHLICSQFDQNTVSDIYHPSSCDNDH